MDYKKEAEDKLSKHALRLCSLACCRQELERLALEQAQIRARPGAATPVPDGQDREDALLQILAQRQELDLTRKIVGAQVSQVQRALDALDETERLILDRFFIHRARGNVERLMDELHAEKAWIYRLKDRALRRFTLALYGLLEL